MCFSFKIDDADADGFDVSSAVLWLYKNKQNYTKASNESQSNGTQKKQTIVVSEVEQQLDSTYLPVAKTIAIQSVDVQGKQVIMYKSIYYLLGTLPHSKRNEIYVIHIMIYIILYYKYYIGAIIAFVSCLVVSSLLWRDHWLFA